MMIQIVQQSDVNKRNFASSSFYHLQKFCMQKSANTYWSREYSSVDFFDKTKQIWLNLANLADKRGRVVN